MLKHLVDIAKRYAKPATFNGYIESGHVAAALETDDGNIYSGVSIDSACSWGSAQSMLPLQIC